MNAGTRAVVSWYGSEFPSLRNISCRLSVCFNQKVETVNQSDKQHYSYERFELPVVVLNPVIATVVAVNLETHTAMMLKYRED